MNTKQILLLGSVLAACGGKGGAPAPGNRPTDGAAVTLPGTCIDPLADGRTRMEARFAGAPMGQMTPFDEGEPVARDAADVDGDGAAERVVISPDGTAWMNVEPMYLLYVMRGACGHFVGDLLMANPEPGPEKHHGLSDLKVVESSSCEGAPCGCEYGTWWYRFDGNGYVKDDAASTNSSEKACD